MSQTAAEGSAEGSWQSAGAVVRGEAVYGSEAASQHLRYAHRRPCESQRQPLPVCVAVHGGFWRSSYSIDNSLILPLADYFVQQDYLVVLPEYRRTGMPSGGFPGTCDDIIAALRYLPTLFASLECAVDTNNITILGHSAGAHLALYASTRLSDHSLPFRPRLVVALAPLGDLVRAHELGLSTGGDATKLLMGCEPDSDANRALYQRASPAARLPVEVPCILAVGVDDDVVPASYVKEFYDAAIAHQSNEAPVHLLLLSGIDHFTLVDPAHSALKLIHSMMQVM